MRKTLTSLLVCFAALYHVRVTSGYDLIEVPNFADREKWVFVEERPLIYSGLGQEIGTV